MHCFLPSCWASRRYGRLPALQSFSGSLEGHTELDEDAEDAEDPEDALAESEEHDPFVPPPTYEETRSAR